MITKRDLIEAWHKATGKRMGTIEDFYDTFTTFFKALPDDEPTTPEWEKAFKGLEYLLKMIVADARCSRQEFTTYLYKGRDVIPSIKDFIRQQMKKLGEEVKNELIRCPDDSERDIVNEALRKRGCL